MTFDLIIANPPYAKIGCDITKNIIERNPDSNYAMLGTRSMFKPFYADTLACAFVQIGRYELGSNTKLDWGVEQAILLATNGWTEVVDNRKKDCKNKVGMPNGAINPQAYTDCRTSHLVGVDHMPPTSEGFLRGRTSYLVGTAKSPLELYAQTHLRSSHLVGTCISPVTNKGYITDHIAEMCEVQGDMRGKLISGQTSHLVQLPRADTLGAAATHCRSTTLVQANKSDDTKLRNGYIYVAFETFEEACECAIDIISWKNPTDSHYRCIRWGFVCGLVPHYK